MADQQEETLVRGQEIKLHGYDYRVAGHVGNYWLYGINTKAGRYVSNDQMFKQVGLQGTKHQIVQNIIGEATRGGPFPQVRTLEQLTKVVKVLRGSAG